MGEVDFHPEANKCSNLNAHTHAEEVIIMQTRI